MTKSTWKNFILESAENSGFMNLVQNNFRGSGQYLYVLTYHRVDENNHRPWLDPHQISATPQQFEEQMKFLATRYNPISAEDLVKAANGGPPLPKDAVLVTVDDGYLDFNEVIFPLCNRFGIRPLLFMPTAYIGTGTFWWDKVYQIIYLSGRNKIDSPVGQFSISSEKEKFKVQTKLIRILKQMPDKQMTDWVESTYAALVQLPKDQQQNTLTWDNLVQLVREGATVACHTHSHSIMTQISIEEARKQVVMSQELIRQKLGHALPIFAFPDGQLQTINSALFEMLHSEGFEILFTLIDGRALIEPGNKKMILPRLSVWQSQTLPQFHMRLTPLVGRPRDYVPK
jgi:peptidoglycan/xylan/chitin deacetylase (PgdA/CDA1 family)